jgi:diaminopimelate epimerase
MVKFAHHLGIHRDTYRFVAIDGEHTATLEDRGWVNLKMKDVHGIQKNYADSVLNTGSPHYIKSVADVKNYDVYRVGREIRYSSEFAKEGINVNFVEGGNRGIFVRTYERGVENETLSCGTGVTAASLVYAHNDNGFNRVEVETLGGHLAVEFDKTGEEDFENIWLCGPAQLVFTGIINV